MVTPEQAKALREPFPDSAIGHLPKAGIQLDYVGHAAVTDRFLAVDPEWTWEPMSYSATGSPLIEQSGPNSVMWIRLTLCGVTRPAVGTVATKSFELEKQLISDALRNGGLRFGVALDLWSKEDLDESRPPARAGIPTKNETKLRETPTPKKVDAASRGRIDAATAEAADAGIQDWVKDQGFPWPWTDEVCAAIEAKAREGTEPF